MENMKNEEKINFLVNETNKLKLENITLKKEIDLLKPYKEKYEILESKLTSLIEIIKNLELKTNNLEKYHSRLILKSTINSHHMMINSLSVFPSGNFISVSDDKTIQIRDKNYNLQYKIIDAHNEGISYVSIKDNKNFSTCSWDKTIKIWTNINNIWSIKEIISNAHNNDIYKIIYSTNNNIISCSKDNTVKIWKLINENKHQCEISLKNSEFIHSILLLEDKNILICSGKEGSYFWDIIKYKIIAHLKNATCVSWNSLTRFNNTIIIGGLDNIISIVSIEEKKIIKIIDNNSLCWGICFLKEKNLIVSGGVDGDIKVYNMNFECIQTIEKAHNDSINGLTVLNNGSIASFSLDSSIKIWDF